MQASVSRLYLGETQGQFTAGIDSRLDIGVFFVGADIKTAIRSMVANESNQVIGFLPDRTSYQISGGLAISNFELNIAHTYYRRIISSSDLSMYQNNINPGDTDTVSIKVSF